MTTREKINLLVSYLIEHDTRTNLHLLTILPMFLEIVSQSNVEIQRSYIDNLNVITCGDAANGDGSYEEIAKMVFARPEDQLDALGMTYGLWQI